MEKRVMTEELRKQMAGYLPFSKKASIDYTPKIFLQKDDKDKYKIPTEFRPVFSVRCFTKEEYDEAKKIIQEELIDTEGKRSIELFGCTKELVRKVIKGWHNYHDLGSGEEIVYGSEIDVGANKELWDAIPDFTYIDIRNYVHRLSGISPGEMISLK